MRHVEFGLKNSAFLEDAHGVSSNAGRVGSEMECGANGLVGARDRGEICVEGAKSNIAHEDKVRNIRAELDERCYDLNRCLGEIEIYLVRVRVERVDKVVLLFHSL